MSDNRIKRKTFATCSSRNHQLKSRRMLRKPAMMRTDRIVFFTGVKATALL
jgi:hypothetical protein